MAELNGHVVDDLPRLLTGEANREDTLAAGAHLRGCDDCRHELVSAVVSHASLTSAQRFAPGVVRAPRPSVGLAETSVVLPDLGAVFAQVRQEAEAEAAAAGPSVAVSRPSAARSPRSSRRVSRGWLVAAAAVVVGGGIGAGSVALSDSGHSGSGGGSRSIALAAFDAGHTTARATVSATGTMQVDATSLPTLASDQRYEIWLTNTSRSQMMPIGWIGDSGTAKVTVPSDLMNSYSDIEVSVQKVDSPSYEYSGTSVLRGSY